jgi:hypothetical protein
LRVAASDRGWSAWFESLRVFWYRRVVSFDRRSQLETLQAVKDATETSGRYMRDVLTGVVTRLRAWAAGPWDTRRIAGFAGVIAAGFAGAWLWREYGRAAWRRLWRGGGARREDPIRADAGRWLVKFAATENRTEESVAVTAELQRLRFGARATWPPPERVFRRARRVLRATRRRRFSPASGKP